MKRIRVLLADDASTVRRLISRALADDPSLQVVATAATGRIALAKLETARPDVVILDLDMPELDGLETLAALRRTHPRLPVIVFSAHTSRGAAATLDALLLGANDCVPKSRAKDADTAVEQVRKELIPRIKALCGEGAGATGPPRATVTPVRPAAATARARTAPARIDIVAIGASTGGPRAVTEIATALPAGLPVPVLVVQHMPPVFTSYFAERLGARTGMRVAEATSGVEPGPGELWIAPGDQHLVVAREGLVVRLELSSGAKEHSCRPAVDPLFRSVADVFGAHALAVVLTGMGQDGLDGAARIAAAGGQVLVQDEGSSVVWGMPGAVARAGHADAIVPLERIASEIVLRVGAGRAARGNAA